MAEQWWAIVDKNTGHLISTGTVVADELPEHWEKMPIEKQPDSEHRWDHTQRKLVPHPPLILVDRLEDFLHYPGVRGVLAQLSPQGVQAIKDAVIYLLGQFRQRHEHSEDHL